MKNKVYIILGPTCTGKTSLAIEFCKKCGGEIVSADSRQVYKYMDIGTGKLPVDLSIPVEKIDKKWIFDGVNIWGYDLVTPDKYFSAYDYAQFALPKIKDILGEDKGVFLVGGTGFYIDIVTGRKKPAGTKPDFELRKALETTPTKNLLTWLTSLNPEKLEIIDTKNRARIIRALEIELRREKTNTTPLPYLQNIKFIFIGLTAPREVLYEKVDVWLENIWGNGLLDEVKNLLDMGFGNSPKLHGLVYKSAVDFLEKKISEDAAKQRAKFDLHAYVRRQQTWFKKNKEIEWFDITNEELSANVENLL